MITISLCMIVKNEEKTLGRCLDSIRDAVDEIVIVDTGSTDRTKKTAERYTDRIYDYSWQEDFGAARNFSLKNGSMEYLMWLDADDVLPEKSREMLIELKRSLPKETDMILMPYVTAFNEHGEGVFSFYRERIVRNGKGFAFAGRVHEVIPPNGNIVYAEIPVEHHSVKKKYSRRNLAIYEDMKNKGEHFGARDLYYYGRELLYHGDYKKSEETLERFLACPDGWAENKIDGTRLLAVCRYRMADEEGALQALLKGLEYDVPRGETCCNLGKHILDRGKYEQAVYWYEQALSAKKKPRTGAFISEECYGYLPAISLCVCHDRMGNRELAEIYNEIAGKYRPDSPQYLWNQKYFQRT